MSKMVQTRVAENAPLTCLFCRFFLFDTGLQGYSEYTPGEAMEIGCALGKWTIRQFDDLLEKSPERCMTMAATCEDFELSNLAKKQGVRMKE